MAIYGIFDVAGYVHGMDSGEIRRSDCGYYAAWVATDGRIHAVTQHTALKGNYRDAFAENFIRVMFDMRPGFGIEVREHEDGTPWKMTHEQKRTLIALAYKCEKEWHVDGFGAYDNFSKASDFIGAISSMTEAKVSV